MAKKQNFYYVLVMEWDGPAFVTSIDHTNRVAHWDKDKQPKELGKSVAEDLTLGLNLNGHLAFMVCSKWDQGQPYAYNHGHFEWVKEV